MTEHKALVIVSLALAAIVGVVAMQALTAMRDTLQERVAQIGEVQFEVTGDTPTSTD